MNFLPEGYVLIRQFEDCRLTAYEDVGGVWTVGYGHTGEEVVSGLTINPTLAETWLAQDVMSTCHQILHVLKISLTDEQFTALGCLVFNIGIGNFEGSTLLNLLNLGEISQCPDQFPRWCKIHGVASAGLLRRRLAEQALFVKGSAMDTHNGDSTGSQTTT